MLDIEYLAQMEHRYRESVDLPARLRAGEHRRAIKAARSKRVSRPQRRGLFQWVTARFSRAGAHGPSLPAAGGTRA